MKYLKPLLLLCAVLLVASCHKKRKAFDPGDFPSDAVRTNVKIVDRTNDNRVQHTSVSSKINLTVTLGDKEAGVGGTLRMKRDEVVQLTLVAYGLMEVGRLEFAPDEFLIVDRINHRYVRMPYADVDFFQRSGIDFYTFQSLFWNELFLFGGEGQLPQEDDFKAAQQGGNILLLDREDERMKLHFVVSEQDAMVSHTRVTDARDDTKSLDWIYRDFSDSDCGPFPAQMDVRLALGKRTITLSIALANLKPADGWETRTKLSDRYQPLPLEGVWDKLLKLAE